MAKTIGNRYEMGDMLGRGATATVFRGKDTQTGEIVAVKQIAIQKLNKKQQKEIVGEMEMLTTFQHENIVKVLNSFKNDKEVFYVLEFMENGSLSHTMKQLGTFPEDLVAQYISQALKGLGYLHSHNVIHRDIKGDNLLISKQGRVCLADFGLAVRIDPDAGTEDMEMDVAGTPYWLAPEVILMTAQTTASDVWSLGATVLELLTGDPPYGKLNPMGAIFRIVQDDQPPFPKGITELLINFLWKTFDKNVQSRATATQLLSTDWILKHKPIGADVKSMRDSISVYNRRPTVTANNPLQGSVPTQQSQEELEKNLIEQALAAKDTDQMEELDENKSKVLDAIKRCDVKVHMLQKRIEKRKEQEQSLEKLGKIYRKRMGEQQEEFERRKKTLTEALFMDIKQLKLLEIQRRQLKESIYSSCQAISEQTSSGNNSQITFVKDDIIFIIKRDVTPGSNIWYGEHSVTVQRGFFSSDKVKPLEKKSKTFTKKTGEEGFTEEGVISTPETVLEQIEAKSRKDKLAGMFGTTGNEIEHELAAPKTPQLTREKEDKKSSSPSEGRKPSLGAQLAQKVGLITKSGETFSFESWQALKCEDEDTKEFTSLEGNSKIVQYMSDSGDKAREYKRDAMFYVYKSGDKKEKVKLRCVILFNDTIVVTKWKNKDKKVLKSKIQWMLKEIKTSLVTEQGAPPGIDVVHKSGTYRLVPSLATAEKANQRITTWLKETQIKQ